MQLCICPYPPSSFMLSAGHHLKTSCKTQRLLVCKFAVYDTVVPISGKKMNDFFMVNSLLLVYFSAETFSFFLYSCFISFLLLKIIFFSHSISKLQFSIHLFLPISSQQPDPHYFCLCIDSKQASIK